MIQQACVGMMARRRGGGCSKQQATYLAMISIGNYDVYRSTMTTTTGRKNSDLGFIEPKLGTQAAARALIPKAIRFAERRFGPYPFNSAGIVVKDTDVGYALETQNRPVFDNDEGETVDDLTNVHEWAHQWYGNSVTLSDWRDIWLNEGFAGYAEWLWDAAHGGRVPPPNSSRSTTITRHLTIFGCSHRYLEDPADLFDRGSTYAAHDAWRPCVRRSDRTTSSSSSVDGRSRTSTATSPPLTSLRCPSGCLAETSTRSSTPGSR